jgi:hypothetical protein
MLSDGAVVVIVEDMLILIEFAALGSDLAFDDVNVWYVRLKELQCKVMSIEKKQGEIFTRDRVRPRH